MPKLTYIASSLLLIFIIVISVFSYQSDESIIVQAGETADETFYSEDIPEDNYQGEHFSFFLPETMEVEEVDNFNAILENGDKTIIIFYNTLEGNLSKLNYEAAKTDDAILFESFEDDNKFGYIRVLPSETEGENELQIGVGGVKVTVFTTKSEVIKDAEDLMNIALSIVH
ncbi:hypothetical protein [Paucisalibacillus sp. EB02]|uniref:hypothetical protein n=1 Tax=Paucisalibacillus sp. EB02 TaxID=1347087 RepID=UPI0004AD5EB9|nr:hypothetical protein [Paucisalibacillus sp. EB02]